MTPHLLYQRWLEHDPPESCAPTPPIASWVLPLPDSSALLTLLYRPLTNPKSSPRTRILLLSPTGDSEPWGPSTGYPAPVMFYHGGHHDLYGVDLTLPGKVYVCDPEGDHIATLTLDLRMASLLAPQFFRFLDDRLHWINKSGHHRSALVNGRLDTGIHNERPESAPLPQNSEIHFPYTHLCSDGCLYILDHDPMPRLTKYQLS